ncbi:Aromatic amino acid aminotransferase [Fulvia fulva]|nr:Aromatic amino acid aminotransferase [Fulvia fulva]KAK4622864.1 Aromatic amino acid aminotransferase [Fulvia fulva]
MARDGPANDTRPPPKDLSHHLSRVTKQRHASSIKMFYKYFQIPGIGQLAGGLPNNYYFPFDTLEAKVARPDRWQPTEIRPVDPPSNEEALAALSLPEKKFKVESSPLNQPQDAILVPHTSKQANPVKKIDLSTALQYGTAQGYPPLYYFIRHFTQQNLHPNCPYKGGPEVVLTNGNTDGFSKVLQAFTNEWSADKDWIRDKENILVEEFAYMAAVQAGKPRGLGIVPVAIDDEGMLAEGPGGLKDVLQNWDHKKGKLPHLMYTVTMGQNPTSGLLSLQRRRELYALCSKYDILIVEDDPYWYLQFPTAVAVNTTTIHDPANTSFNPDVSMFANGEPLPEGWKSSGYKFLDSLVPSSINIDTDGRVIRLDTFSKTVAPGCRLGWITAQPALIERLLRITEVTTQQPSGFVQSMIAELVLGPDHSGLDKSKTVTKGGKGPLPDGAGWKADGWVRWLEGLRGNYERRMNHMARILDDGKYLVKAGRRNSLNEEALDEADEWSVVEKTQILSFDWPVGGMFLWLKIHFESHPLWSSYKKSPERLSKALWILWTTKPFLVLVAPGSLFSPTDEIAAKKGWQFFRLCFAALNEEDLGPVTKRIAEGTQAFFRIKDKKTMEKLLEEGEEDEEGESRVQNRETMAMMAQMMGPC